MSCSFIDVWLVKDLLPDNLGHCKVLDIGSGRGFWGWYLRTLSNPPMWITGIEINQHYIDKAKNLGLYDQILKGDLLDILPKLQSDSYDLVIAIHVIEHLSKEDGYTMLGEAERVARDMVIVSTPNGESGIGIEGEYDHDMHLSGWYPKDFKALGYSTKILQNTHTSGRVVKGFESLYRRLKRRTRLGNLVAWKNICVIDVSSESITVPEYEVAGLLVDSSVPIG